MHGRRDAHTVGRGGVLAIITVRDEATSIFVQARLIKIIATSIVDLGGHTHRRTRSRLDYFGRTHGMKQARTL
jgi:hypothetical protein